MAQHKEEEETVEYELKVAKLRHRIKRERSLVKRWELEKELDELEYDRFMQQKRRRDEKARQEAKEREEKEREAKKKEEKEYSSYRYSLSSRDKRAYREKLARE